MLYVILSVLAIVNTIGIIYLFALIKGINK